MLAALLAFTIFIPLASCPCNSDIANHGHVRHWIDAPRAADPDAYWDTLLRTKQFFALRDTVSSWRGANTRSLHFFRGELGYLFNRPVAAVRELRLFLQDPGNSSSHRIYLAYDALGTSLTRDGAYREAWRAYRDCETRLAGTLDSAEISDLRDNIERARILQNVPPQRIERIQSRVTGDTLRSVRGDYQVRVAINGRALDADLGFDTGASLTVLDSSTAARYGVHLLEGSVPVGSITGAVTAARLGTIASLDLGPVVLTNVVTLVFRDADLTVDAGKFHLTGLIGFPVIAAIGAVSFTRTGYIIATARARASGIAAVSLPNLAIEGGDLAIRATRNGKEVVMHLDTGAGHTMLYPPFLAAFPELLAQSTPDSVHFSGVGGTRNLAAHKISGGLITIGGANVSLAGLRAMSDSVNAASTTYAANLGRDVLQRFESFTLDFNSMTATLGR